MCLNVRERHLPVLPKYHPMDLPWFNLTKRAGAPTRPRGHDRVNAVGLSCHLGDVLDMSAGGMRISREGRPDVERGTVLQIALKSSSQKVQVGARVVWVRRVSWKRWELGLQFVGVAPAVAEALVDLAKFGYVAPRSKRGATAGDPGPASAERESNAAGISASVVEVEDLYAALCIASDASPEDIHRAYRKLARELHPDVNTSPDAPAKFTFVSKAYSVLRDPDKRRRYDALLAGCAGTRSNAA